MPSTHHQDFRFSILGAAIAAVSLIGPARAQAQLDVPCTDGVFAGDVTAYYQEIKAASGTPGSVYDSLSWEKKLMVDECANRTAGPDSQRYNLRELAFDGSGNVIGRVYDYLETADRTICNEPFPPTYGGTAPTVACRQGRFFHVAIVLSGCYTDNVFGASDYVAGVGWTMSNTDFQRLRQSDRSVANASCTGSPGFNMNPFSLDATGQNSSPDGGGALINDADAFTFNESFWSPPVASLPFGMHAATSTVWNMLFSRWDAGDSNGDGIEERDGQEDRWTSPWVIPSSGSDSGPANPLCDGLTPGSTCDLGYATSWFDQTNMWEWQVVYEFSWDVSSCTPLDADSFVLDFLPGTHASPSKNSFELCGDPENLGALTLIKDSVPDNPWNDFEFNVTGPSPGFAVLQDPGADECVAGNEWATCGSATPWNAEDRFSWIDLIASNNRFAPGPYVVTESAAPGTDLTGYDTSFVCRNVDTSTCSPGFAASLDDPFTDPACAAVQPTSSCGTVAGFVNGVLSGTGLSTPGFSVCPGSHVICKFTNEGGDDECVTSANAIGDLQVFGGVQTETSAFSTAAVPLQSADAPDSIFLTSFIPLADEARWPGNLDHFVLPLPLVENADQQLVPDFSVACADDDDTSCLAWRAGDQLLTQSPTAAEVTSDRRIGLDADERRVTYTNAASGDAVPRTIRALDWAPTDALSDEYDLWNGLGLSYTAGDTTSEASARTTARSILNQTLQQRQVTIPDPDAPSGTQTLTYVAGDFFHSDPVVVGAPNNFFFLANDLEGNGRACDDNTVANRGYRCFFEKNQRRRQVVVAASNDGQIHGFDAGQFEGSLVSQRFEGQFTLGTGKELFAHLPRPMLEHVNAMTVGEHDFGVDGGMVVDDVFIDPKHAGTADEDDREWRTVIVSTYRQGERGLVALDVTQPDPIQKVNVLNFAGQPDIDWVPAASVGVVPGCAELGGAADSACGTLSYPAQLWEFDDQCLAAPCDEDSNGEPDLGESWSQVNTGRILVNVQGESVPVVKFVAVFGGGLDPENREGVGNWVYMVDIETGKAIYKREVTSAVPSEPAAVDTDQDGFIDTMYFGTVGDDSDQAGIVNALLYKVDLSTPADIDPTSGRITDTSQWEPFAIFDTGVDCHEAVVDIADAECHVRSIFYPPTVTFVASQGKYAVAFGTGDREDLFGDASHGPDGRFYVILDPGFQRSAGVLSSGPLTEASFQTIDAAVLDPDSADSDFLTAPLTGQQPGWVLRLSGDERVVTKALLVSGLLVFTTFTSEEIPAPLCTYQGDGKVYALLATNANSIAGVTEERAIAVEGFAGRPVVTTTGMTAPDANGGEVDPFEQARIQGIRDELMDLFPADCRFGNYSLNVSVALSNTSVLPVASVPVCIARKNWTEHF